MNRRDVMTLLGGAAAWPVTARAQQPAIPVVGFVSVGSPEISADVLAAFRQGLRDAGYVEGESVAIEYHWLQGRYERVPMLMADLVRRQRTLPIVFAHITDPVTSGFVSSLARPGGNITGFADSEPETRSKLVEFARQLVPDVMRIATIGSMARSPIGRNIIAAIANAAASLGLKNTVLEVSNDREIEDAIVEFGREPNGAVIVPGDPVTTAHRKLILAVAGRKQLPVIGGYRPLAADGALLSYGANVNEQYQGAASYVDRILKGEKPAALPVQQPTKYELRVNVRTAKALGLAVPPSLLARADEVIE